MACRKEMFAREARKSSRNEVSAAACTVQCRARKQAAANERAACLRAWYCADLAWLDLVSRQLFRRNSHGGASARNWLKNPLSALPHRKNCSMLRMPCKVFNVNIVTWLPHVFKSDESASGV